MLTNNHWGPFHRTSILGMCLKITNLRLKPHFTEASELMCSMWHYAQPGHHGGCWWPGTHLAPGHQQPSWWRKPVGAWRYHNVLPVGLQSTIESTLKNMTKCIMWVPKETIANSYNKNGKQIRLHIVYDPCCKTPPLAERDYVIRSMGFHHL